jgi:hypothetical protein
VLQRRPNTFAQTILSLSFFACDKAADHTFRFARHPPKIRDKPGLALERIASTHRVVARSCANSQIPTGNNSRGQLKVIKIHLQRIRATIAVTSSDCFPALN